MKHACCLLLLLLIACPSVGKALLASNGDELEEAIRAAKPGDEIVLKDGVWRDISIVFNGQGTEEAPITLRAQTPGKVILSGESNIGIGGRHLVVSGLLFKDGSVDSHVIAFRSHKSRHAYHCRVTNCAIVGYDPPDIRTGNKWVSFFGSHNRLDHCHIEGKASYGSTLVVWLEPGGEPNHHRIDHNYFGPRPPYDGNGAETMRIGDSKTSMQVSKTIVEDNLFEACDGEIEIISNKSCENIYRRNTFRNCAGTLTLRHGNRCIVDSNYFLAGGKKRGGGIRVIGEGHRITNNYLEGIEGRTGGVISLHCGRPNSPLNEYFQVKNTLIAFNTLVHNSGPGIITDYGLGTKSRTLLPENVTIANNLVLAGPDQETLFTGGETPGITWLNNLAYGADLGIAENDGIRLINPLMQQDDQGLWRPANNSPALGMAEGDFPGVTADMDGQPRIGKKDIGADQASEAEVKNRPLTRDDVGIDWVLGAS